MKPRLTAFWAKHYALWLAFCFFSLAATAQTQVNPFEKEIAAFEAQDKTNTPAKGKILLVGSSSFRLWKTIDEDLAGFHIINRGFGGSQMPDVLHFFDRVVLPYQPSVILVYEGDNDLVGGKKSVEQVMADYRTFTERVKAQLPNAKIGFLSIKPSIARANLLPVQNEFNQALRKFCKSQKGLRYIEVGKVLYGKNGQLREELFEKDKLHITREAYILWGKIVRKHLKALTR